MYRERMFTVSQKVGHEGFAVISSNIDSSPYFHFYARDSIARISYGNSVRLSVCLSVRSGATFRYRFKHS